MLGCWQGHMVFGLYIMIQFKSTPMNKLIGYTAVCYASISTGLLVQGWELSTHLPEAAVPAGLSDIW